MVAIEATVPSNSDGPQSECVLAEDVALDVECLEEVKQQVVVDNEDIEEIMIDGVSDEDLIAAVGEESPLPDASTSESDIDPPIRKSKKRKSSRHTREMKRKEELPVDCSTHETRDEGEEVEVQALSTNSLLETTISTGEARREKRKRSHKHRERTQVQEGEFCETHSMEKMPPNGEVKARRKSQRL